MKLWGKEMGWLWQFVTRRIIHQFHLEIHHKNMKFVMQNRGIYFCSSWVAFHIELYIIKLEQTQCESCYVILIISTFHHTHLLSTLLTTEASQNYLLTQIIGNTKSGKNIKQKWKLISTDKSSVTQHSLISPPSSHQVKQNRHPSLYEAPLKQKSRRNEIERCSNL